MVNSSALMIPLPTRIDRYPAKMISHLADRLVSKYATNATHVLDPFCGSGAVLRAAMAHNIQVTGVDINPFGVLLSSVKVEGFDPKRAHDLLNGILRDSERHKLLPIDWDMKNYWFTPATLEKLESIRAIAYERNLHSSKSGRAVLLSIGLAARLCSKADQRSPKPFISKTARKRRRGKHYSPAPIITSLLNDLSTLYGTRRSVKGKVITCDIGNSDRIRNMEGKCSHAITSPPYINAQDYFRNSKLELYLLEKLIPFSVKNIRDKFIGSERGLDSTVINSERAEIHRKRVPQLLYLEQHKRELAVIVHTYLQRMENAFSATKKSMNSGGTLVVVCGDNLIGGKRIVTWKVLNEILTDLGFILFDSFEDKIRNRAVAPSRCGHKGLIKQEVVSAFRLSECP
ncbi:MAG: hypothetical protein CME33_15445 [Gimesia sp.]|mgnify:CR=1 FL=1|uniref:class I SAM-dependent methyltransferase n=1 Tax=Gimesia sp. TaxID=2024833 RepID=UPI000C57494C|nr:class I SAM-dependent methyltransferase [Gimesia sp.]MAX37949.1 hypothetical protein [Gimesia sp.]|tara:strand:+ start:5700 stop:6902 length:1203 start_codon:yes stop_codon:yes gene_type:complete